MMIACAQAFDTMLLLKRGGEAIYNGPLGFQSRHMISYFEAIPGKLSATRASLLRIIKPGRRHATFSGSCTEGCLKLDNDLQGCRASSPQPTLPPGCWRSAPSPQRSRPALTWRSSTSTAAYAGALSIFQWTLCLFQMTCTIASGNMVLKPCVGICTIA